MKDNARGREIIDQILENMRGQTEELRYSKVVSSAYNVHLHADDYARIEGLIPEVVSQARRALNEELARLNRSRPLEESLRRWFRQPRLPYQRAAAEWSVSILPDPNDELEPGDILVDATLVTSGSDQYSGSLTQRIVTHRRGGQVERRVTTTEAATEPEPTGPVLATLRWRDQTGEHTFRMARPSIKVGRGGSAYWVDVKVDTVPDVSREHFRIRFDEASRRFFIQDLSSYGTTVDGVALPAKTDGGAPESSAPETPLAARATIGLAGALVMGFEAEAAS